MGVAVLPRDRQRRRLDAVLPQATRKVDHGLGEGVAVGVHPELLRRRHARDLDGSRPPQGLPHVRGQVLAFVTPTYSAAERGGLVQNAAELDAQLTILNARVTRLVALRGDLPSGYGMGGEFHYASDLVAFIRAETGDAFHIEVAAYPEIHPQAKSADADLQAFAAKVRAGANSAITQYFYNADAYFHFVEEVDALGISIPVVPGIMPITSSTQLLRFSDACGAEIPRWIRLRLQGFGDDTASIKAFGLDVVTDLCEQLRAGGAPGLHFYSMNQSMATLEICKRLAN